MASGTVKKALSGILISGSGSITTNANGGAYITDVPSGYRLIAVSVNYPVIIQNTIGNYPYIVVCENTGENIKTKPNLTVTIGWYAIKA